MVVTELSESIFITSIGTTERKKNMESIDLFRTMTMKVVYRTGIGDKSQRK